METQLLEGSAESSCSGASGIQVLAELLQVPGLQDGFLKSRKSSAHPEAAGRFRPECEVGAKLGLHINKISVKKLLQRPSFSWVRGGTSSRNHKEVHLTVLDLPGFLWEGGTAGTRMGFWGWRIMPKLQRRTCWFTSVNMWTEDRAQPRNEQKVKPSRNPG